MKTEKPLFFSRKRHSVTDNNGNKVFVKQAKLHGRDVELQIVLRSELDLSKSRHQSYTLLVP